MSDNPDIDSDIVDTEHFTYQGIDSDAEALRESYRLRYQVYCLEKPFLSAADYPNAEESDEFDRLSAHFGAYNRADSMIGAGRMVMGENLDFPLFQHCQLDPAQAPKDMTGRNTVEISRLVVSKLYRRRPGDRFDGAVLPGEGEVADEFNGENRRKQPEIVLGLYQIMYRHCVRMGVRYCLAAMERSLPRLLARNCFHFQQVGPEVDYFGPVAPYVLDLAEFSTVLQDKNSKVFAEFTAGLSLPEDWLATRHKLRE